MKKLICICLALAMCLGLAACGGEPAQESQGFGLWSALLVVLAVAVLAVAGLRTWNWIQYNQRRASSPRRRKPVKLDMMTVGMYAAALLLLLVAMLSSCGAETPDPTEKPDPGVSTVEPTGESEAPTDEPTTAPTEPPVQTPVTQFTAHKTKDTDPINWGVHWEILVDGQEVESYTRPEPISFGAPSAYFTLPGVGTFRGNNYRDNPAYGTVAPVSKELSLEWSYDTDEDSLTGWSGCGWTGQPLLVQWDEHTRNMMNLYPDKKDKEDLVEVIYAALDGHIYFLDLEDGTPTRDDLYIGMCFKGAGSLDPRGYPILYVGSGDTTYSGKQPRFFIISLTSGAILYEYGNDDPQAIRKDNDNWCAFDSAPLVDAETDTLIWPGENGVLYTMKLNTAYNAETGKLTVDPGEMVTFPCMPRY